MARGLSARARITGVGATPFGELPGSSVLGLHATAARAALDDAGLAMSDVDGVVCAYSLSWISTRAFA